MFSIQETIRRAVWKFGYNIRRLTPEDRHYFGASFDSDGLLPDSAVELRLDNPRLQELRRLYAELNYPVCEHTLWDQKKLAKELTLPWFRGDNAYVWQFRQVKSELRLKQYIMLSYVEARDELGLFSRLEEDGAFGCWTFSFGERPPVSRDLLESINEINFLERQLKISEIPELKILDVGAGYGRLAHRMCDALPNVESYTCVDAVAESSFLCEYYIKHRGIGDRARSVPLHTLDEDIGGNEFHLALNIHSFSECTRVSVRWWLSRLRDLRGPYLLIVPNDPRELLTCEADGSRFNYAVDLEEYGYTLIHKEAVFDNDEMRELMGVNDQFYLFSLIDE